MKKRSMILALASMLGVSAAATAVSGFAWFTAQTTASIVGGTYKVGAAGGNLSIAVDSTATHYNCTPALKTNDDTTLEVKPADKDFADVSSVDGENFYKLKNMCTETGKEGADFVTENNQKSSDSTWMSKVNSTQMVAVTWTMTVTNSVASPTMDVYLSNSGALFEDALSSTEHTENATGDAAKSYVDAYRLAIFNGNDLVFFYANGTKGLVSGDAKADGSYDYATIGNWDGSGTVPTNHADKDSVKAITNVASIPSADTKTVTDKKSQLLVENLGATAVKLKFVVWCDGSDTPENAIDVKNKVSLSMGLIGLNTAA